jgi:hypothetical protein
MERTIPPANSHPSFDTREKFQVHDNILNKTFPARECTDEQLGRAFTQCQTAFQESAGHLTQAMQRYSALQATMAMIEYEIDRRRRTLTIAREIPR